jgi:hypothetical protein
VPDVVVCLIVAVLFISGPGRSCCIGLPTEAFFRWRKNVMKLKRFTDPLYGSDTQLTFDPAAVIEVEDRMYRLFPFRKYPATYIKLRDGKHYWAAGHHAAEIKAAQEKAT